MALISNPCSLRTFQGKQGCFTCLSKSERLQLKLWFLQKLYSALGGGGELLTLNEELELAACFGCESDSALDIFEVSSLIDAAAQAGAKVDGVEINELTAAQLKEQIKCYSCADPKLVRAGYTYGLCLCLQQGISQT